MKAFEYDIEMLQMADDEKHYDGNLTQEEIENYKIINKLFSEAERKAKLSHCVLCKKECSSFCNSHSVPRFALSRIAENGKVSETLKNRMPLHEKSLGVKQTGTFKLICNACDNEIFQDYENPTSYSANPTNAMIAQIAIKNYLQMIYKRLVERELFDLLGKKYPQKKHYTEDTILIKNLDLVGYLSNLKYAQKAVKKPTDKFYHLYYYKVLDYVVPFAAQTVIPIIGDFNDEVINDLYNLSPNYELKDIHVAVFPLEKTSVVMLFVEEGEKRYRKFYKQFKKLSPEDQLAAVNYIIFAYSENVFLNPKTQNKMKENKQFIKMCGQTIEAWAEVTPSTIHNYDVPSEVLLSKALKEFSLSKRHEIPNLLSEEYSI